MTEHEHIRERDTSPALAVGDEVMWAALNGNVRTGKIIEWFAPTGTWFVEFYPSGKAKRDRGFSTWLKPEELIKVRNSRTEEANP